MTEPPRPDPSIEPEDPHLWLEDVDGGAAMDWVRAHNRETEAALGDAGIAGLEREILEVLDSDARIPYISKAGAFFYNLWRDAAHPRGLWRRTTLEEYRKADPAWEPVLDLDELGRAEGKGWVFHGARFLRPGFDRCLVLLSPGGSDAVEVREFDPVARTFVADGFRLPPAKTSVGWIDRDTLFLGTDTGPGSMTASGYPRQVRAWRRGTDPAQAPVVFEGRHEDMMVEAHHDATEGFERDLAILRPSFFSQETWLLGKEGTRTRIEAPPDAEVDLHRQWLLIRLRSDWIVDGRCFPSGALLATELDPYLAGRRRLAVLFRSSARRSLEGWSWTRGRLILNVLDNVRSRLLLLTPGPRGWHREPLPGAPAMGHVSAWAVDAEQSDDWFLTVTDYLTPESLWLGSPERAPERLKAAPACFDASGLEITQHFARSLDGTRIPYFQVSRKDLVRNGSHPTLLYGYGGFEVSLLPGYGGVSGRAWLARGGVYVVANIRGGGEFGPRWHQAALKQNRHKAYEDFEAVARALCTRRITSPAHLGIQGGSNGGLLVGNMLTRCPERFAAVVCQVPLLDMRRYTQLLAGASWMEEYGDPDRPEDWAWLKAYSPYHNVQSGRAYPLALFMTTTRDDRVHPGHARKMAARMLEQGHAVSYFENTEGGHGAGADNRQSAHYWALGYAFLWRHLGRGGTH